MSKIITQKAEGNKHISERIKIFMKKFDVSSALKSSNALKVKGSAVIEIFHTKHHLKAIQKIDYNLAYMDYVMIFCL